MVFQLQTTVSVNVFQQLCLALGNGFRTVQQTSKVLLGNLETCMAVPFGT